MFLSIYLHPHSRIQASSWIYQNIPKGSVLTVEYWDDAIPLNLSPSQTESLYSQTTFNFYEMDTEIKWEKINKELKNIDFIIMSSNRLWASIPKVPQKYPITSKFYQDLFDQKLNFQKTIEINSYPGVALPFINGCYYFGPTNFPFYQNKNKWFTHDLDCNYPGFYLRDDIADESFTVYDHPKVLIYSATDFR